MSTTFEANFRRITAGQTVTEIAAKTGLDQGSISRYREGKRKPGYERLQKIARVYDVSEAEFFKPLEDAA
jgi:transcriptional regulator with XRE-family HTH domain